MAEEKLNKIDETCDCFVNFLRANEIDNAGIDFASRAIRYEFTNPTYDGDRWDKFTVEDFRTAYTGFVAGYHGQKNEAFGQLKLDSNTGDKPATDIETLIVRESAIRSVLNSDSETLKVALVNLEDEKDISRDHLRWALNLTQEELYKVEYDLGRNANTLNE